MLFWGLTWLEYSPPWRGLCRSGGSAWSPGTRPLCWTWSPPTWWSWSFRRCRRTPRPPRRPAWPGCLGWGGAGAARRGCPRTASCCCPGCSCPLSQPGLHASPWTSSICSWLSGRPTTTKKQTVTIWERCSPRSHQIEALRDQLPQLHLPAGAPGLDDGPLHAEADGEEKEQPEPGVGRQEGRNSRRRGCRAISMLCCEVPATAVT